MMKAVFNKTRIDRSTVMMSRFWQRKRTTPAYMTDYVIHSSTPIAPVTLNEKEELLRIYYETLHGCYQRNHQDSLRPR